MACFLLAGFSGRSKDSCTPLTSANSFASKCVYHSVILSDLCPVTDCTIAHATFAICNVVLKKCRQLCIDSPRRFTSFWLIPILFSAR